jgi:hypothetical protein
MPHATQHVLWETVQKEEQKVIARPGGEDGIAGLAISGGGIRSATFALGVLESLKDSGLLSSRAVRSQRLLPATAGGEDRLVLRLRSA